MKVLFVPRRCAFQTPGGGEVQLKKTKEYLEKLNVEVDIFSEEETKIEEYDIVHLFATSPEHLPILEYASRVNVPTAISTIHWNESAYEAGPLWRIKNRINVAIREALVNFGINIYGHGQLYELADVLLPNSEAEKEVITRKEYTNPDKIRPVHNGVDSRFTGGDPSLFKNKFGVDDFCLYVGRIDPRKNLVRLVEAFAELDRQLVIVGPRVNNYADYYERVRQSASEDTVFTGSIDHDSELLESAYAAADTFVLPSHCETPGLAALEAGLAGCDIAITERGCTREYFRDYASYIDPDEIDSIVTATRNASSEGLEEFILDNYTWDIVAEETLEEYKRLLNESDSRSQDIR